MLADSAERVAIPRQDHPGGEGACAFAVEGVEGPVDDLANVTLADAGAFHSLGDASGHSVRDRACELGLEARCRAEMMEQVGVGSADLRRDRF